MSVSRDPISLDAFGRDNDVRSHDLNIFLSETNESLPNIHDYRILS
jgi:hypothetical protein